MAESRPWQGKTGGGKFGQQCLFAILRHVNATVLYPVVYLVVPFYFIFSFQSIREIYRYFRRIHGFGRGRSLHATCRNVVIFGRVVIDKFALLAGRSDQFRIAVDNMEVFDQLLDKENGFMMASSHIGNFELCGHCLSQERKTIYGIVFGGESEAFQQRRDLSLQRNHVKLVPVRADMSHLFTIKAAIENGDIITIPCDRMFGSAKKMTVDFLGHPADFPIGPFRLAAQMNIPVIAVFIMKGKGLCYNGHIFPLNENLDGLNVTMKTESLLRQFVKSAEQVLRKYPEQWFNYYHFWK